MRNVLTTALILAAAVFAADTAREQTLQRAIDLMESKGDLAKAMPLFEEAARSADKALAARALLYLGQGQERHGIEKARSTYERIVREFSGQAESVAVARKRLAALGSGRAPERLTKRLICSDCGDPDADISPDGRLMVFTDWDSGDLATRDLKTGQIKRLFAKTNSFPDSKEYAESPAFSPDGRQVAYLWEKAIPRQSSAEVRLLALEPGGKPRVLITHTPEFAYFEPKGWSPDGRFILVFTTKSDRTWQMAWVSTTNGSLKVLKSLGWRLPNGAARRRPALSPDGRYIAYSALATDRRNPDSPIDTRDLRIYVIASDGSSETEVVKTIATNESPVWSPDGKHLLFSSDRSGSFGLWALPIENGKPAGSTFLVTPETGRVGAQRMSASGSVFLTMDSPLVETVTVTGTNAKAGADQQLIGIRPSWSPDGRQLALIRRRGTSNSGNYDLVVYTVATGEERLYSIAGLLTGSPRWLHHESALLVGVQNVGFTRGLHRVDLPTGNAKQVYEFDPSQHPGGMYALSPDDQFIYHASYASSTGVERNVDRIIEVHLQTGTQRQVCTIPVAVGPVGLRLSPDGRTLAIRRSLREPKASIDLVQVDGSNYRVLHQLEGRGTGLDPLGWSSDSQSVLFSVPEQQAASVMRAPVDGGRAEKWLALDAKRMVQYFDISPDGTRLAFSALKGPQEHWAIDNVASALK